MRCLKSSKGSHAPESARSEPNGRSRLTKWGAGARASDQASTCGFEYVKHLEASKHLLGNFDTFEEASHVSQGFAPRISKLSYVDSLNIFFHTRRLWYLYNLQISVISVGVDSSITRKPRVPASNSASIWCVTRKPYRSSLFPPRRLRR